MPERRRQFSPQFNAQALGNWVNVWRLEHPEPDQPVSPVERARVKELEDEVAWLGGSHRTRTR
jgi:hypothetical protein